MHKICKILYFADQMHLSLYSKSITGDDYIAMTYGPVPSKVDDMFKAVRGDSYFSNSDNAVELKTYFTFYNKFYVIALKKPDTDYLSETNVECLDKSTEQCRNMNFEQLTQFSHGIAWENPVRIGRCLSKIFSANMAIAKSMSITLMPN